LQDDIKLFSDGAYCQKLSVLKNKISCIASTSQFDGGILDDEFLSIFRQIHLC
jgi:hypothetical protein